MIDFSKNPLALAPLAGYTDLPFRKVVKKFGADLTYSEMISSNALVYQNKKTLKMLEKSPLETPYIVQIAGSNKDIIKEAVLILNDIDGIDGIDLNCGCPVPKVVSQDAGSSLLLDLPKLKEILQTIKKYSKKRYLSAKVRLGFEEKIPKLIAQTCEEAGVDFISMHGRTRADKYKKVIDYDAIKEARKAVNIPMFANGDITSLDIALHVKNHTKCEGLMIGRGAVGNPWIFYQIKNNDKILDGSIKHQIIMEHFDAMVEFYGKRGVSIFRKHLHTYSKGYVQASKFRDEINKIEDIKEARDRVDDFFSI
ncbi:MAG: tRNA dihydrouridine synthase DusB [Proteobacteria bacterium]|nr:MAG: tRNA dihydrouridine synthase DusB [Pseudomonadota bacterium]